MTELASTAPQSPRANTELPPADRVSWAALPGAAIVIITNLVGVAREDAGVLVPLLLFTAWALMPYAVLFAVGHRTRRRHVVIGAGLVAAAFELGIRLSVFVFPSGSTAPIALVFSPALVMLAAMPVGAAAGWLTQRATAKGSRLWSAAAITVGASMLALITLGLARPDLFPTAVYARRRALARIGDPGVRIGGDSFASIDVTTSNGWFLTGEFDGQPGDELAVVDRGEVQTYDGLTLAPSTARALSGEAARWNWYSQLARSGGDLVRVDIGGGFQETQVMSLDGVRRFLYRPDATLPPNALRSADLDGDGDAEFYASTQAWLTRLDAAGREVWRQPQRSTEIVALQPRTPIGPAWVVTRIYGQPLTIWSPDGERLADVPERDTEYRQVLGIIELSGRRLIAYGGAHLTLRTPGGATTFEWQVPDMQVVGVWAVRLTPLNDQVLVVQSVAGRDVRRARLQFIDPSGNVQYDKVTAQLPRVLIIGHADGSGSVLSSTPVLHAIRRR